MVSRTVSFGNNDSTSYETPSSSSHDGGKYEKYWGKDCASVMVRKLL